MPARDQVARLLSRRDGHFALESGHHGDLWLDLERLFLDPGRVAPLARELAKRLERNRIEAVCGPLVEGAFVGVLVASALGVAFTYSAHEGPFRYRIPDALRAELAGRRVAVVNDVINAGSAVIGTLDDLEACGARPVAIATLAILGDAARRFAEARSLAIATLASFPNTLWEPASCPLCARGVALSNGAS